LLAMKTVADIPERFCVRASAQPFATDRSPDIPFFTDSADARNWLRCNIEAVGDENTQHLNLIWKGSCQEALLEIFGPWISFRKMNRTGQRTNSMLLDGGSD